MSECKLCEERAVFYGIENGNKSTWQLSYDDGLPVLRTMVDNHHLGFSLSAELQIRNCPMCGREL